MLNKHQLLFATAALCTLAAPGQAEQRKGLRGVVTYNDQCGVADTQFLFLAAALGVVLEPAIKAGINALGAALQNAGAPDEATVTAKTATMFYRLGSASADNDIKLLVRHSCITIAVGVGAGDGPATATSIGDLTQSVTDLLISDGFSNLPSFVLEGKIEVAADRTAWRYVPNVLFVGSPLTEGGWLRKSGRDLVLTLTLRGVGAKADDAVIGTQSIAIDRSVLARARGTLTSTDTEMLSTGWFPMPQPNEAVTALLTASGKRRSDRLALQKAKADYSSQAGDTSKPAVDRAASAKKAAEADAQIVKLNDEIQKDTSGLALIMPTTIELSLHETRDGNKFVADVGKALSDSSDKIAKSVADQINPEIRRTTAISAGAAQDKLHIDAITAVGAWQASKTAGEDNYKQRIAKQTAIGACRTLELNKFADPVCLELQ